MSGLPNLPPPDVSVVICTHDPDARRWERTLAGLRAQTLPVAQWELVIVDNASATPVADRVDHSWHPRMRFAVESKIGLTAARVRGITEACAALLVFVDDDNVLAPEYLAAALDIAARYSFIGAWGGTVAPEFEHSPASWATPYLGYLALRDVTTVTWSNSPHHGPHVPCGAGLCIRAGVARHWVDRIAQHPNRLKLGRKGQSLASGEDTDLALTACDLGTGVGVFPSLRLTHLIPSSRLSLEYFERLVRAMHQSEVLLRSLRHPIEKPHRRSLSTWLYQTYSCWRMPAPARRLRHAADRGYREGLALCADRAADGSSATGQAGHG